MVELKQKTFGIRKGSQRIVFMVMDADRVRTVYLDDDSKDSLEGYSIPLDCDEWCVEKGLQWFVLPISTETEIPVQVARAIWRWCKGLGWGRFHPYFPKYKKYYTEKNFLMEDGK